MQRNALAVALAALAATALAVGGVAAAPLSAPTTDVQPADHSTDHDYEVVDHDDWLADRDADGETVAALLFADDRVGDALRSAFDADADLAIDVYGSLERDADAAHVVVTPAPGVDESAPSEQHPRVEATVDLGEGTAALVGVDRADDARDADETVNASDVETVSLDGGVAAVENASAEDVLAFDTFDGDTVSVDAVAVIEVSETADSDSVTVETVETNASVTTTASD